MPLAELSAEERAYLSQPLPCADAFAPALAQHLSRVLGARMKYAVQVQALSTNDTDLTAITLPQINWDRTLDTLWLHARLGRSNANAQTPSAAMTKNLLRTLQLCLAETWMSLPTDVTSTANASLRLQITGVSAVAATLQIRLPLPRDMNHWAQHIIRHAI